VALFVFIFWLKGHKIHHYDKFSFYFRNVNGLEEGAALRWNGLKIGVVESIKPVTETFDQDPLPADALLDLGKRHLEKAARLSHTGKLEDLVIAQEAVNKAQLEIALGKTSNLQTEVRAGDFVQVDVVVTLAKVPIGLLNQVTIVPSGLIGEQYVDITTIDVDKDYRHKLDCTIPKFVVLEPVRLDTVIRVNAESAEAVTNLSNRLNALFSNEDAENIRKLVNSTALIAGDAKFRKDLRESASNVNKLTKDFKIWKLL
jgi:ABC-type transporter Mla subunit MlaD